MHAGRLHGKVAQISGAARGIGLAAAQAMCAEAAAVLVRDALDAEGRAAVAAMRSQDAEVVYQHLDVTDAADWQAAAALADKRFGGVDILVNNAAIYSRFHHEHDRAIRKLPRPQIDPIPRCRRHGCRRRHRLGHRAAPGR